MAIKSSYHGTASSGGTYEMSLQEFKKWLKKFDADKDGRISQDELKEAVTAARGWFSRFHCKKGVKLADKNGNGFIDEDEINNLKEFALKHLEMAIIEYRTPYDGKRVMTLEEFKKQFDSDHDGRISKEELRQAIRAAGGRFSRFKCKSGIKAADKNGNGYIDENEIKDLKDFALKHLGVRILV